MSLKFGINSRKAERVLKSLGANTRKQLQDATAEAGVKADGHAKKSIQRTSGGGKTYEKYNPRRTHQASAPGSPPNTDTGDLVSSIFMKLSNSRLAVTIGSRLKKAVALEFGTSKMAERPFLRVAANYIRPIYVKSVVLILKEAGKRAKRKGR